jgi:hypothetical protein
MFLRSTLLGAVAAALAPASASAAPVFTQTLKPCYVAAQPLQRETIDVRAEGFTPMAKIDILLDDIVQQSAQATFEGKLAGSIIAPWVDGEQRDFTLRLAEQGKAANGVSATSKVTRLAVEQLPAKASTAQRVRFRGRGFTSYAPIYAHYVFAGKSRKTVRIGVPTAPCGTFSVRRKQFPFKRSPKVGVWTIQFDQLPRYDPQAATRVPVTIKVRKAIKRKPARAR